MTDGFTFIMAVKSGWAQHNLSLGQTTNSSGMDLDETTTCLFSVKIWIEETAEEAGQATWRGHITHVSSGERRYVEDLDDITVFVVPYLERMGVKLGIRWRLRQWLKR